MIYVLVLGVIIGVAATHMFTRAKLDWKAEAHASEKRELNFEIARLREYMAKNVGVDR